MTRTVFRNAARAARVRSRAAEIDAEAAPPRLARRRRQSLPGGARDGGMLRAAAGRAGRGPWRTAARRLSAALVDRLLERVSGEGLRAAEGTNVIAYSGGVDSSLAAAAVYRAFPENTVACIGISPALPQRQLLRAREVAAVIGVPLREVGTGEGSSEGYVANAGDACYHCKTHLYDALSAVRASAAAVAEDLPAASARGPGGSGVRLFNGTNKDDLSDPTRVGLVAASEWDVRSPLDDLTKAEVRSAASALGLPNAQDAASPCLRSRLAIGVEATEEHLARTEAAEALVRDALRGADGFGPSTNLRVRTLSGNRVAVEVDERLLPRVRSLLDARGPSAGELLSGIRGAGFGAADVVARAFRSGSVSDGSRSYRHYTSARGS